MTIELRDVTMENYFDVLHLDVKEYQKQFIATNVISLAEAYVYTKNGDFVAPLAVYDNDAIIGFVMIAYDKKIGISSGNYLLFRFMIDKNFQNQGYFECLHHAMHKYFGQHHLRRQYSSNVMIINMLINIERGSYLDIRQS